MQRIWERHPGTSGIHHVTNTKLHSVTMQGSVTVGRAQARRVVASVANSLEEYCPSCGGWVSYLAFDHSTGWCLECSGTYDPQPRCSRCGDAIDATHGRTMCHTCRREVWLITHADDLEYLIVAKGYTVSHASDTIVRMVRPRCQWCGKPIHGAHRGALFHKANGYKGCRSASLKFKRLVKQGLTIQQALATIRSAK